MAALTEENNRLRGLLGSAAKLQDNTFKKNNILRKILKIKKEDLELHKKYLKTHLPKNFFR